MSSGPVRSTRTRPPAAHPYNRGIQTNNYFQKLGISFVPTKVGFKVHINKKPVGNAKLGNHPLMASDPNLAEQIRAKKASLPKPVTAPKAARKPKAQNGNNNNSNANGPTNNTAAGGRRRFQKHASKKNFVQIGAGIGVPKNNADFAQYQVSALFSSEALQSYSGGELETRAIETAVQHAKSRGDPIDAYKFKRENNGVINPGNQIFTLPRRTFIFKPRFSLADLKVASNSNQSTIGRAMSAVLKACREHKSKGKDHVETDLIEFIPGGHINLYELKIGEGKPEGFPAEAYQLYKSKRILELEFERLYTGRPPPKINMYFLAWGFNLVSGRASAFSVEHIKFKKPTEWAGGPAIHALFESHKPGWDTIKELDPAGFAVISGLKSAIVTAQLIRNRESTMKTVRKVLGTMERRHGRWRTVSPQTRLALERTRRMKLVSGRTNNSYIPQGNLAALHDPNGARWANYIKNWSINKIKTNAGYTQNEANNVRNKEYRTFDRKWYNALSVLKTHNIVRVSTGQENIRRLAKYVSSSESNAPRRHEGRAIKNYVNKLKILILMLDSTHMRKFPVYSRWVKDHDIRAVPGALTRADLEPVFRFATNENQRTFLNGFIPNVTNASVRAVLANDPEARLLAAQANAMQAPRNNNSLY
jgi:hypothetical protein